MNVLKQVQRLDNGGNGQVKKLRRSLWERNDKEERCDAEGKKGLELRGEEAGDKK